MINEEIKDKWNSKVETKNHTLLGDFTQLIIEKKECFKWQRTIRKM